MAEKMPSTFHSSPGPNPAEKVETLACPPEHAQVKGVQPGRRHGFPTKREAQKSPDFTTSFFGWLGWVG